MAEEVYTFSEEGMRKLVAAYREQQRDMVNLRRALTHYSTRRHEAVYLPGSKCKLVTPISTLYAAYGGGDNSTSYNPNLDYGDVESNALAISTGNYIPISAGSTATLLNRVTYPGNCYVWEENSSGVMYNTGTIIQCINPTGLPIAGATWCKAHQLHGSDCWVATKIGELARASKDFLIAPGTTVVAGDEKKIIRYAPTLQPEGTVSGNQDWAHVHGNDVFIHHPGTYTITFGAQVTRYNAPTSDTTRYTDSDDADYIDLPNPADVEICCLMNWNPSVDSLAAWPINERLIYMSLPAKGSGCSSERTFTINHTLDNWHGQPYMRLSLAMKVTGFGTTPADTEVNFRQGWIHIRPEGGAFGGNEGTGYNAFLGTDGAHQWWGGGTEPGDFDEDGVAI